MCDILPERVALLEQHIETQNGILAEIRDEQRQTRREMQELARSLSFFKGAWTGITVLFGAAVAYVTARFKT